MAGGATYVVLECRRDPATEGFDNMEDLQAGNGLIALGAVDRQEPQAASVHAASGPCDGTVDMWTSQTLPLLVSRPSLPPKERMAPPSRYVVLVRTDTTPGAVRAATLLSGREGY
jgi:hypothetical protein